jgi:glutathione S-transferase
MSGEEFKKINPLQLVPVIDDGGFVVTERFVLMMEGLLLLIGLY